jgi:hypothetical protein
LILQYSSDSLPTSSVKKASKDKANTGNLKLLRNAGPGKKNSVLPPFLHWAVYRDIFAFTVR